MDRDEARQLAHDLSVAASTALCMHHSRVQLTGDLRGTAVDLLAQRYPLSADMVSSPWAAYALAIHDDDQAFYVLESGIEGLLGTMPIDYRRCHLPNQVIGPYADSLVAHLASLINFAETELIVVAPYWSVNGVADISRRVHTRRKPHLQVSVLTAAAADAGQQAGAQAFCDFMNFTLGAQIRQLAPKRLNSGFFPLLHAKAIVADRKRAYVGSANFSQNGLSASIELGVGIAGSPALQVHEWFASLMPHFELVGSTD